MKVSTKFMSRMLWCNLAIIESKNSEQMTTIHIQDIYIKKCIPVKNVQKNNVNYRIKDLVEYRKYRAFEIPFFNNYR